MNHRDALYRIERYLTRYSEHGRVKQQFVAPHPRLRTVVVIPAMAEMQSMPGVIASLESELDDVSRETTEVIVVVNQSWDAQESIKKDNEALLTWLIQRDESKLNFSSLSLRILAVDCATSLNAFHAKEAGVGMARRIGMDLALHRLMQASDSNAEYGVIVSLDADSTVKSGYLRAINEWGLARVSRETSDNISAGTNIMAAVLRYEHPINMANPDHSLAIIHYELWLRYVEYGLYLAGSPYHSQRLGSCIITTTEGYVLAGGMSKRKAGEDFYYLQQIIKQCGPGCIEYLDDIVVYPSDRISRRVPFGTGPALHSILNEDNSTYEQVVPFDAFYTLRVLFEHLDWIYHDWNIENNCISERISPVLFDYLEEQNWRVVVNKLRVNHSTVDRFRWAFHCWFDGVRTLQYLRHYRSNICSGHIRDEIYNMFGYIAENRGEFADNPLTIHRGEWTNSQAHEVLDYMRNLQKT